MGSLMVVVEVHSGRYIKKRGGAFCTFDKYKMETHKYKKLKGQEEG